MHLLLIAAAALVGWPMPITVLVASAIAGHGLLRGPLGSPALVLLTAEGLCSVPEWSGSWRPLGPRTLVCPYWVRLDLGTGPKRRDILLLADQVRPEEWRRLRARLSRLRCD